MVEARKFWLPNSLHANYLAQQTTAFEGLSQMGKILRKPYTPEKIYSSLDEFTENLIGSGEFGTMLKRYLKGDTKLDPKKFRLLSNKGYHSDQPRIYNIFACDGVANLILFYGDPKDKIGGLASIELLSGLVANHKEYKKNMDMTKMAEDDLVINQIQGPLVGGNDLMQNTFSHFRWERLLVEIFVRWATQAGLQKIYLLPHTLNAWKKVSENENGTAYLRYDVTAKRLGFRRQKENEPYLLSSDGSLKKLFDAIFQHP